MEDKRKVILSVKDLEVRFNVRGRKLTAIRGINLDIYEGESIAIVGESGSGKSVLTKTFSGMTDSNGFISKGEIILRDDEISQTVVRMNRFRKILYRASLKRLDLASRFENGADIYNQIQQLKEERVNNLRLPKDVRKDYKSQILRLRNSLTEKRNELLTYESRQKEEIRICKESIKKFNQQLIAKEKEFKDSEKKHIHEIKNDLDATRAFKEKIIELKLALKTKCLEPVKEGTHERNELLVKEIILSASRYSFFDNITLTKRLCKVFKQAMKEGKDLTNDEVLNAIFDKVNFRVKYVETHPDGSLEGYCIVNLAKVKKRADWNKIRGTRIATVFQDPMTSLNPIIRIGDQICQVIMKHQHCSKFEAKKKAIKIMEEVGIDNPEKRFYDYPFQYSGGMRQRIVIAIALSCKPNILICDEPTTALDVTIQAQILKLIKRLQVEYGFTTIYITHDLGVVANVADRVVVLYAGQAIEIGNVEEVFYDPRHPYTWALLASLPQLSVKGEKLFSISGTPPSLYTKVKGDAFAQRSQYSMAIDFVKEPPMFKISDTHYAKTWLLDPRAPKVEKPKNIVNLHETFSGKDNALK